MKYRRRTYALAAVISAAASLAPATAPAAAAHGNNDKALDRLVPTEGISAFTFGRQVEAGSVRSEFLKIGN